MSVLFAYLQVPGYDLVRRLGRGRRVKIWKRTISLIFTAYPQIMPQLEFQPDMAHTEAQRRRRGRGEMRHELEKTAGLRFGIGA